jgi:hypothetical protein
MLVMLRDFAATSLKELIVDPFVCSFVIVNKVNILKTLTQLYIIYDSVGLMH